MYDFYLYGFTRQCFRKISTEYGFNYLLSIGSTEDAYESKKRALVNLIKRLQSGLGKTKYKAWIPVPILLRDEKTSTRIEHGKSLYAKVAPETEKEGIIDAAIWVGYAWADEPRNRAVVMVTGDNELQVKESAEMLAQRF